MTMRIDMSRQLQPQTQTQPQMKTQTQVIKHKKVDNNAIYVKSIIHRQVSVDFKSVGNNIQTVILKMITHDIAGKCIREGYVKPEDIKVLSYSSGLMKSAKVIFDVIVEVFLCNPVEGMLMSVFAVNVTKAGIKAEIRENAEERSFGRPVVVFVARDYHNDNDYFNNIREGEEFVVRVIGTRSEFNDQHIYVIAEIVEPSKYFEGATQQ